MRKQKGMEREREKERKIGVKEGDPKEKRSRILSYSFPFFNSLGGRRTMDIPVVVYSTVC